MKEREELLTAIFDAGSHIQERQNSRYRQVSHDFDYSIRMIRSAHT